MHIIALLAYNIKKKKHVWTTEISAWKSLENTSYYIYKNKIINQKVKPKQIKMS